jgi:hypothetical protein
MGWGCESNTSSTDPDALTADAAAADAMKVMDATVVPDIMVIADAAVDAMPDVQVVSDSAVITDAGVKSDAGADTDGGVAPDGGMPVGLPDLELLRDRLLSDVWLDERIITEESCVFIEGCVGGVGARRLLRFSVVTANIGDRDLVMGRPQQNEDLFAYSECHEHFHFESYANYSMSSAGEEITRGHKQAFCLMDTDRYWTEDETVRDDAQFSCSYQGISRGWQDTYGSHLDCQWIDVTDIEPGTYQLTVEINNQHIIEEKTYDNNNHTIDVTVPAFDIAAPCPEGARNGTRRSCGWTAGDIVRCNAGDLVEVGCGGCGELGEACMGNPMMRICEGEGTQCLPSTSLTQNNNGCGESECPHTEFMCPESRVFTIWTAANDVAEPWACVPAVRSGPPQITRPCNELAPEGLERTCGWTRMLDNVECRPGFTYRVGCNPGDEPCNVGGPCNGDPMLRVCEGGTPCLSARSLVQNDDGCGTQCPATSFECPLRGRVSVFTAGYRNDRLYRCEAGMRILE